jgi:hypothetical protein
MRTRLATTAAIIAALAGCGDDSGSDSGGITGAEPTVRGTDSTHPAPGAVSAGALRACLGRAEVEVVGRDDSYEDARGEQTVSGVVEVDGTTYVGLALWPSKHVAYVYAAPDDGAAGQGEEQLKTYVKGLGGDPSDYVQRQGTVVVLLDDHDQPTPAEASMLDKCARG